jgi:hypothetical protein
MLDISLPVMVRQPIVLVGGAVSGKSATLKTLVQHPKIGPKIMAVPEVFTNLVAQGVITPSLDVEENRRNQKMVAFEVIQVEKDHALQAVNQGLTLVCDRGLPDSAVFLLGGIPEFEALIGHTLEEALGRYGLVIELGSPPEDVFNAMHAANPARIRSYTSVYEMEKSFTDIYSRHANYVRIPYSSNWEDKVSAVTKIVEAYLG